MSHTFSDFNLWRSSFSLLFCMSINRIAINEREGQLNLPHIETVNSTSPNRTHRFRIRPILTLKISFDNHFSTPAPLFFLSLHNFVEISVKLILKTLCSQCRLNLILFCTSETSERRLEKFPPINRFLLLSKEKKCINKKKFFR